MYIRHRALGLLLLVSVLMGSFGITAQAATAPVLVERKLDGVMVPKGTGNPWPVTIMIDEHTAARPESGLQSASIVYETLAEGGIPRFMAVFADTSKLKYIGPIRSTRPYFVRYAAELNAVMVHGGGSPDGLALIKKLRIQAFMGISGAYAKYFFRAFGGSVHGLYTNGTQLTAALKKAGTFKVKAKYSGWQFGDTTPKAQRANGKHGVIIDFSYGKSYIAEYRYDKVHDAYLRFTGGKPLIDRLTKKQISTRNVIIINTPKAKVLDRKGRLDINVIGKGTGYLLQAGKATKITWTKKNDRTRTMFYNAKSKQEIVFTRGNTWIDIVPAGHKYKLY